MFHMMRIAMNPHSLQEIKPFLCSESCFCLIEESSQKYMCSPPGQFMYGYSPYLHYATNMWKQSMGKADALGSPRDTSV